MKKQIFLIALMTLVGMSSAVMAQKPQQGSTPSKGEALYVETTKYLKYSPAKGYESEQVRYDRASKVWLVFKSTDSSTVEAWIYDYDPGGRRVKKINILMHLDVPERYGYFVYKFSYLTFAYEAGKVIQTNHPATEKLFGECLEKIGNRLDDKKD